MYKMNYFSTCWYIIINAIYLFFGFFLLCRHCRHIKFVLNYAFAVNTKASEIEPKATSPTSTQPIVSISHLYYSLLHIECFFVSALIGTILLCLCKICILSYNFNSQYVITLVDSYKIRKDRSRQMCRMWVACLSSTKANSSPKTLPQKMFPMFKMLWTFEPKKFPSR